MKDPIDDFLKQAKAPEWPSDHWETFPQAVRRKLANAHAVESNRPTLSFGWKLGFAAVVALGLAFIAGFYVRPKVQPDWHVADSEKVIREMKELFPDRIRSITINSNGMQMQISDSESVLNTQAIVLRVCPRSGDCEKIITFSGQTVVVAGKSVEALVTADGDILLVGQDGVWSSADKHARSGATRIEAKALELNL